MTSDCMDDRPGQRAIEPTQDDVERAREWLLSIGFQRGYVGISINDDRNFTLSINQIAALIAASRGTRALTEEEREQRIAIVLAAFEEMHDAAAEASAAYNVEKFAETVVSRLTGECRQ